MPTGDDGEQPAALATEEVTVTVPYGIIAAVLGVVLVIALAAGTLVVKRSSSR